MNLPKFLTFITVFFWVMLIAVPTQADINPRNTGKTTGQQVSQEQMKQQSQQQEKVDQTQLKEEDDDNSEEQHLDSNSSLNFIFYMIYKVKFEDLFRLPERSSTRSNSGLNLINIHSMVEYLNNPKI